LHYRRKIIKNIKKVLDKTRSLDYNEGTKQERRKKQKNTGRDPRKEGTLQRKRKLRFLNKSRKA